MGPRLWCLLLLGPVRRCLHPVGRCLLCLERCCHCLGREMRCCTSRGGDTFMLLGPGAIPPPYNRSRNIHLCLVLAPFLRGGILGKILEASQRFTSRIWIKVPPTSSSSSPPSSSFISPSSPHKPSALVGGIQWSLREMTSIR